MLKVPPAGENHRDAVFVTRRDHLIIPFGNREGATSDAPGWTLGIMRCTYPRGEILERLLLDPSDPVPNGPIAWFPDRTDRIVFTSTDGRLYRYVLSSHGDSQSVVMRSRLIEWNCNPPMPGKILYTRDLDWPSEPPMRGRLLVLPGPILPAVAGDPDQTIVCSRPERV